MEVKYSSWLADLSLGVEIRDSERCQSESRIYISPLCHVVRGLIDTWKMFLYAPGSRQLWKFGFTECAGSPELSWLRLGWLGPRPRMMQVLHYSKRSDELLEQRQECTWAEEPLLGVGRQCDVAPRSLPTVKQRCVMTRAINFCRSPALFPTLQSPMGPLPWGPRGHWEYPICSLYHIAQKDASRVSS